MENSNYKNHNIEKKDQNTWFNLLINYIFEPIRNIVVVLKIKSPFFLTQTHGSKPCMVEKRN